MGGPRARRGLPVIGQRPWRAWEGPVGPRGQPLGAEDHHGSDNSMSGRGRKAGPGTLGPCANSHRGGDDAESQQTRGDDHANDGDCCPCTQENQDDNDYKNQRAKYHWVKIVIWNRCDGGLGSAVQRQDCAPATGTLITLLRKHGSRQPYHQQG